MTNVFPTKRFMPLDPLKRTLSHQTLCVSAEQREPRHFCLRYFSNWVRALV